MTRTAERCNCQTAVFQLPSEDSKKLLQKTLQSAAANNERYLGIKTVGGTLQAQGLKSLQTLQNRCKTAVAVGDSLYCKTADTL